LPSLRDATASDCASKLETKFALAGGGKYGLSNSGSFVQEIEQKGIEKSKSEERVVSRDRTGSYYCFRLF